MNNDCFGALVLVAYTDYEESGDSNQQEARNTERTIPLSSI